MLTIVVADIADYSEIRPDLAKYINEKKCWCLTRSEVSPSPLLLSLMLNEEFQKNVRGFASSVLQPILAGKLYEVMEALSVRRA